MKIVITTCLVLLASPLAAEEQQRVYQTDAYGRIVEVDGYGNKRHDKPQYVIRKDREPREVFECKLAQATPSRESPALAAGVLSSAVG